MGLCEDLYLWLHADDDNPIGPDPADVLHTLCPDLPTADLHPTHGHDDQPYASTLKCD